MKGRKQPSTLSQLTREQDEEVRQARARQHQQPAHEDYEEGSPFHPQKPVAPTEKAPESYLERLSHVMDSIDTILPVKYPSMGMMWLFSKVGNRLFKSDEAPKKRGKLAELGLNTLRGAATLLATGLLLSSPFGWAAIGTAAVIAWGRDMLNKGPAAALKTAPSIIPLIFIAFGIVPVFGPFIALAGFAMIGSKAVAGSVDYVKSIFSQKSFARSVDSSDDFGPPEHKAANSTYQRLAEFVFGQTAHTVSPPIPDPELQSALSSQIQDWKTGSYKDWFEHIKANSFIAEDFPETMQFIRSIESPSAVKEAFIDLLFGKHDIEVALNSLATLSLECKGLFDTSPETTQARQTALTLFWGYTNSVLEEINKEASKKQTIEGGQAPNNNRMGW